MNVNLYPLHSFLQIENAPVRIGKLTNYLSTSILKSEEIYEKWRKPPHTRVS